jgi:hypothetical protein
MSDFTYPLRHSTVNCFHLQPRQTLDLPWRIIIRHLHIERTSTVPQILTRQHRTLLTNKQCSAVRVAAHIIRTDRQISYLEALDAMHIQALVEHAVLDDRVAFARGHGARAEGVPCGLDMAC